MRRRFFVERFENGRATLRGAAAHHAGRVLRAEPGQLYELSDGCRVWLARIERVGRGALDFSLLEALTPEPEPLHAVLALSIFKFDRFEWALEKATELGVADIVLLAATRSEKGLVSAAHRRAARWERILTESAQQSRRLRAPALQPGVLRSVDYLEGAGADSGATPALRLFFSEEKDAPAASSVLSGAPQGATVALAIGPEGGWTEEERAAAARGGWKDVSLGPNILRAETAVVAGLAIVHFALAAARG